MEQISLLIPQLYERMNSNIIYTSTPTDIIGRTRKVKNSLLSLGCELALLLLSLESSKSEMNRYINVENKAKYKKIAGTRIYTKPASDLDVGSQIWPNSLPSQSVSLLCFMAYALSCGEI